MMESEKERRREERKRNIRFEIQWLEDKIKTVKKEKHKRDLQRQLKEKEYELHLGIFYP